MRLDKALALTGCSRTQAKAMIAAGRVQAGGAVARDPGLNVEIADVMLDGAPIDANDELLPDAQQARRRHHRYGG